MRHRDTAFVALSQLDPALRAAAGETEVEARIAAIVALPRLNESRTRHRPGTSPGLVALPRHVPRSRILGLAASAAIAVAAALLWVSPSAGAPPTHGVAASIAVPGGADHAVVPGAGGPAAIP
jgi:hypothetical protein